MSELVVFFDGFDPDVVKESRNLLAVTRKPNVGHEPKASAKRSLLTYLRLLSKHDSVDSLITWVVESRVPKSRFGCHGRSLTPFAERRR